MVLLYSRIVTLPAHVHIEAAQSRLRPPLNRVIRYDLRNMSEPPDRRYRAQYPQAA
jgi:hypothetical protein